MTRSAAMTYLLPHLLERSAEAQPDHPALRFRDESLTYSALHARAAQLANALTADGMEKGDRVGILLNKGLESAVALYGIMLAGGVYVPIDPFAPPARAEFVIRDCGIRRLILGERTRSTLEALAANDVPLDLVVGLEDGDFPYRTISWESVATLPVTPPSVSATELDLCYVLYTSGSTGTPKGIMHTHRSALSWAEVSAAAYQLSPRDVISNYAPLHFDLSTLDFFGGACAGATTVIIPEEHTKFPASLAGLVEEEQLTVFYTVPMALIQLAQPGIMDGRDFSKLRLVLFGGEPMPVKHLREIMTRLPDAEFVNVYGPTETNGCTHYRVTEVPAAGSAPLPIGRPYPNVEALVVDDDSKPVDDGATGELLIRTPTMMRGYWGRDDLNEGAFYRRNQFGGLPEVFHRTGDLVAAREDGTLAFLGRRDRQIKSRGNRVELDEVEAVLVGHDDVREAAVYAVPDVNGSLEIQAAVILSGTAVSETDLLAYLRGVLPSYAVPGSLHTEDAFPRTSSGKIDRLALQAQASVAYASVKL